MGMLLVLGGEPGVGKSTLGFSTKNSILLDFDKGRSRAALTGETREFKTWADVVRCDYSAYDTIVIDTISSMVELAITSIKEENSLYKQKDGTFSMKGYGKLKDVMQNFFADLRTKDADLVVITHLKEMDSDNGDILLTLDVAGSSKNLMRQRADAMGIITRDNKGMRFINFNDSRFGKNSNNFAGSEPIAIPIPDKMGLFLGDLMDKCKSFGVKNEKQEKVLLAEKADILSAMKMLTDDKAKDVLRKRIEATFQRSPSIKSFLLEKLFIATVGASPSQPAPAPAKQTHQTEEGVDIETELAITKDYINDAENSEHCMIITNRIQAMSFSVSQKNVLRKLFTEKLTALGLKYNTETKVYE